MTVRATSEQDLEQLTAIFRLLSDRTRLSILMLLAQGERNVSSLCEELKLPQPTVSHHLGLLRMNNVIANRRSGKQVFYGMNGRVDSSDPQALEIGLENFAVRIGPASSASNAPNVPKASGVEAAVGSMPVSAGA